LTLMPPVKGKTFGTGRGETLKKGNTWANGEMGQNGRKSLAVIKSRGQGRIQRITVSPGKNGVDKG